jgi:signal transduction histidine kinase
VAWSPLLIRTYRPLLALVATVVLESLHLLLVPVVAPDTMEAGIRMGAYQPVPIATMVAAFTVASRTRRWLGWLAGCSAGAVLLLASLLAGPLTLLATDLVMFNLVLLATGTGVAVAARHDRIRRAADDHAAATRQAVLDERLRIARELHDVLAHNLTLVDAQASVAENLLSTDPAAAAQALRGMSVHSARAIDELRSAVGLLRQDSPETTATTVGPAASLAPTPGLDQIDELIKTVRATGTSVDLTVSGTPGALTELGDVAAYRILQEALTNATKHAPQAPVDVALTWSPTGLDLRVTNPDDRNTHRRGPLPPGAGHGLIGMRERAEASGGTLETAQPVGAMFVVRAVLPAAESGHAGGVDNKFSERI